MEVSATLRERKKTATRVALHEAALNLAVAHGLDAVTVDAIADEASVSRRTFSNYFANKEDALLYGDQVRISTLLHALRGRPAKEAPWQALTRSARALYAELDDPDPTWLAQLTLVRRHPALLARQVAIQSALEHDLATEIASRSRTGEDEPMRSRVMAATFLATVRTVQNVWSEHPGSRTLSETLAAGLSRAAERFA